MVKGGIDHVSWKIKWPFHTSRTINSAFHVSREKNVFIRSVFLTLVKNYSQRTALFDVLTILLLLALFLVLWKGNRVLCLEVDARHHLLLILSNTESLSSEESSSYLDQDKWRKGVDTVQLCCYQPAWICRESTRVLLFAWSLITPLTHLGLSILWLAQSPLCLYCVHLLWQEAFKVVTW